jgi:hypothetical protein
MISCWYTDISLHFVQFNIIVANYGVFEFAVFMIYHFISVDKKLRGLNPLTNYTDQATGSCQPS